MTKKQTAEDLLNQKIAVRDKFLKKRDSSLKIAEDYRGYAQVAEEEYLRRDAQVKAMEERIAEGKAADEEHARIRGPFLAATEEEMATVEMQSLLERLKELREIADSTVKDVARINNGLL